MSKQLRNNTALVVRPTPGTILLDDKFGTGPKMVGNILLPEGAENRKQEPVSKIIAVGEGVVGFKPGDVVVYKRNADFKFEVGSITYRLVKPESILCIVEGYTPPAIEIGGGK